MKVKAHSYIALYPNLGTVQSALHLTPGRPVHWNAISIYLGSIQSRCNNCAKTIRLDIHLSAARYSFIQLSEQWQRGMNEIAKASAARGFEPGVLSATLPRRTVIGLGNVLILRAPLNGG